MPGYRTATLKTRVMGVVAAIVVAMMTALVVAPCAKTEPTVIGVNGTTVNLPIEEFEKALGIKIFYGALDFNNDVLRNMGYRVVEVDYPASFGIMTLGGPEYDKSVAIGKAGTISEIKTAQNGDPTVPVVVSCYSQGADACTQANAQLWKEGYDQSSVTYIMLGNVDAADAGLKVRIPNLGRNGVYIPGPGVTLGNAEPTSASDARIVQVTYEYDGFGRAPRYPLNVLAVINAVVGTAMYHGIYHLADPSAPDNIISTTPGGKITNIVIPAKEVPLLTLAKYLGVPQKVVDIINPTLKAVIDTGYDPIPQGEGAYPTEAVKFGVLPSQDKMVTDIQNVRSGIEESVDRLREALTPPPPPVDLPEPSVSANLSASSQEEGDEEPSEKDEDLNGAESASSERDSKPRVGSQDDSDQGLLTDQDEQGDGENRKPGQRVRETLSKARDAVEDVAKKVRDSLKKYEPKRDKKRDRSPDSSANNEPSVSDNESNKNSSGGEDSNS